MMEMIKRGMPIEWEFLTHSFKNTSWTYDLLPKGDACKAGDSLWLSCEAGMSKDGNMISRPFPLKPAPYSLDSTPTTPLEVRPCP